tara:strand:- start:80 stop:670 length:591 start_codon:yes stop_codon:yes gene_type:complete
MKIIVVCAHLMSSRGTLNSESQGRCEVASRLFHNLQYDKIIVPGWAYRDDSEITISSKMKDYLVNGCGISPSAVIEEPRSRDTVGDAVFCRISLHKYLDQITDLTVVTSDYHVPRAVKIFEFVFGRDIPVSSYGSFVTEYCSTLEHNEVASLEAFRNTFKGVSPDDLNAIIERLINHHPFYNGKKYPGLSKGDCAS